jgi:hypothetical protein
MPVDVTQRPEDAPDYSARTIIVTEFFCSIPENRKKAARDELRRVTKCKDTDGMTNVLLEQLWNILTENR